MLVEAQGAFVCKLEVEFDCLTSIQPILELLSQVNCIGNCIGGVDLQLARLHEWFVS